MLTLLKPTYRNELPLDDVFAQQSNFPRQVALKIDVQRQSASRQD